MSTVTTPPRESANTADTTTDAATVRPELLARAPRGGPPALVAALLLAVVLLALAVVLVRDSLIVFGALQSEPWITPALDWFAGLEPQAWMVPVGILVAVVGVWLVVLALRPRPVRVAAVGSSGRIWIEPGDVARLVRASAERVDGVLEVGGVSASRRSASVKVTTTSDPEPLKRAVGEQVASTLASLDRMPTVRVRTSTMGDQS